MGNVLVTLTQEHEFESHTWSWASLIPISLQQDETQTEEFSEAS